MKKPSKRSSGPLLPTTRRITKALTLAAQDAIEAHRRANQPLVIWEEGQVVLVPPDKFNALGNGKHS